MGLSIALCFPSNSITDTTQLCHSERETRASRRRVVLVVVVVVEGCVDPETQSTVS
jgi:hypothetical protein